MVWFISKFRVFCFFKLGSEPFRVLFILCGASLCVCELASLISEDAVIFLWELRPITLPTVLLEASLGVLN